MNALSRLSSEGSRDVSKESLLLRLPRYRDLCVNWCSQQTAGSYKPSECFSDKDGYGSLKQAYLFG